MSLHRIAIFAIFAISLMSISAHALSYPTTTPTWETAWGTYRTYFDNMFSSEVNCFWVGKVVGWFNQLWVPFCVVPAPIGLNILGSTAGDTIRYNGTDWVRNNLLYNNGTAIGVGTQTPGYIFDVAGTANFIGIRMPTGASSGMVLTSDTAWVARWSSNPSISASGIIWGTQNYIPKFGIGWNGLILSQFFDNGTNIGIGTITPGMKVDISGVWGSTIDLRTSGRIQSNSPLWGLWLSDIWDGFVGNNGTNIGFYTNGAGWNAFQIVKSTGDIGIGTSNPLAKLDISSTNSTVLTLQNTNASSAAGDTYQLIKSQNGNTAYLYQRNGGLAGFTAVNGFSIDIYGGANSIGVFKNSGDVALGWTITNATTYTGSKLFINGTSWNVGIGTTTPWALLEVAGQVKITGGAPWAGKFLGSDATGLASWQTVSATSVTATGITWGIADYITKFGSWGNGIYASLLYETAWRIGLGNTNPTTALDIAWQIRLRSGAGSWLVLVSDASGIGTWWVAAASTVAASWVTNGSEWYIPRFGTGWNGLFSSLVFQTGWNLGIGTTTPWTRLDILGTLRLADGTQWAWKYLISDATGIGSWTNLVTATSLSITGSVLGSTLYYNGANWIPSTNIYNAGWNVGIGTATPSTNLTVSGGALVTGNLTVQGKIITDTIINRTVNNVSISGSLLPDSAAPLIYRDIGAVAQRWNNLYLSWQVAIAWGFPWLWKILTSDATGLGSWSSSFSGNTSASGIVGGTQNYITKFGPGGNGLISSQVFDNGTSLGIGTTTGLDTRVVIDSWIPDDSGLSFARLNPNSPLTANGVIALWVNASGKVLPISPISNIAVYNGIDRTTVLSPNPDLNTFNITYDFNRYFAIPGKQSFVVSNGSSSSYNGPYFKENGTDALCSTTGTYGASAYDCANPDPVTWLSASPYNSFTMTAKGDVFGYQIALGARWDAPLFARSGRYNGSQTGWLYTNDAPFQTPAPWQKVLSVPANHPEYFFINTGLSSQLQAISGGWNVGIGTTTPQSRFEVWTGATTTSLIHFRGANNVGMGLGASRPAQTGNANTAFGNESLFTVTSGYSNTAIGYRSLRLNAAGFNNTAMGQEALYNNNGWSWNTSIGYQSLYSNTSWQRNISLGGQALYNLSTGNDNIAIGYQAARVVAWSSVSNNIAIGYQALYSSTISNLTAIWYQALYNNTSGGNNTALGYQSLDSVTTGSNNTAVGNDTLSLTTGSNNTVLGSTAGNTLTSGSNNISIGAWTNLASATASNQLNIGNWIYGTNGNIGIGINNPGAKLQISGLWWNNTDLIVSWRIQSASADGWLWLDAVNSSFAWTDPVGNLIWFWTSANGWNTFNINRTSGNIGIGTAASAAKLEIAGQVKITGGVPWAGKILMSDATGLASWQTPTGAAAIPWAIAWNAGTNPASNFVGTTDNFGLAFRTNNTENMRLLISGNLGIGTNAPASRLSVAWGWLSVGYPTIAAPSNGAIISGNVGIGTSSPSEALTVNGSINTPVDNSAIVSGNDQALWLVKKTWTLSTIATNNANPILFSRLNATTITSANILSSSLTELMRIQNNGDVGIGTSTPGSKLDINGQVRIQGGSPWIWKILVSDATGLASWQAAATGSFAGWWILGNAGTTPTTNFVGTTDNVDFVTRTNGTEKMRVTAGWNVGIGITNPGARLDVGGLIRSTVSPWTYFQGWDDANFNDVNIANTVGIFGIQDATKWSIQLGNNTATYIAWSAGNIGIGILTPGAKLEVAGQVKITGGAPWVGKVLTSDATGLATWSLLTASLTGGTTNYTARWTSPTNIGIGTLFDNGTNVWVNTTSPGQRLDVNGNLSVQWQNGWSIYTWSPTDANWRMGMSNAPGYSSVITTSYSQFATFFASSGYGFSVGDATTGLSAFEVGSSADNYKSYHRGSVGIWVNPTQSLDLNGQIRIRGWSPWVGKYLVSDANGVGTWTTPASSRTGSYIYRMTGPQSSTSTALVSVAELVSTPLPVWPYQFEVIGKFQTAAATTGIGMTLTQTSGASTAFIWNMSAQLTSSSMYSQSFMTSGTPAISSWVPAAGTDYAVLMKWAFEITGTGTVAVQLSSEVNGSQVVLWAGTVLIVRSLDPSLAGWGI